VIPRRTPQLDAVYDVVCAAHDHPTADMVYARVRRVLPSVSLGTVYRNLQKLASQRRVRVIHVGDRVARYDAMVAEHDHFCCERCGSVHDVVAPLSPRRPAPGSIGGGYTVRTQVVTFLGLCPACAATASRVPAASVG